MGLWQNDLFWVCLDGGFRMGREGRGYFSFLDVIKWVLKNWINNIIKDHIIL